MRSGKCPCANDIAEFALGRMDAEARAKFEPHLEDCASCQSLVGACVGSDPHVGASTLSEGDRLSSTAPDSRRRRAGVFGLVRGSCIGRYVVIGELGAGGMGAVYEAYDPKLDRRVALKALHYASDGRKAELLGERLVKEARAMAQLSHPNVVTVYDVLVETEEVFVVMEVVRGTSLRAWMSEHGRGWQEIVEAFAQAGKGLSAAHRAGIVHGDFKPENVLVGEDGRVRVADFGLARVLRSATPALSDERQNVSENATAGGPSNVASFDGSLAGTPAYMAPEQLRGAAVDEKADQFSFSVALYEALFYTRPFEAPTMVERLRLMAAEAAVLMPKVTDVPRPIRDALTRGLRARPEDRHPSVHDLVARLTADPHRSRRRWAFGSAVVACAVALGGGALRFQRAELRACDTAADALGTVWGGEVRTRIHDSFIATGHPYAEDSWQRTVEVADAYAGQWKQAVADQCRRARSGAVDPLSADRVSCLGARKEELRAFAEVLTHADSVTVDHAVGSARALVGLDVCKGGDPLRGKTSPSDPRVRADADALVAQMDVAEALFATGRYGDGLTLAEQNSAAAERIAFAPLVARASLDLGNLQSAVGHVDDAVRSMQRAVVAAERAGDLRMAIRAWLGLARQESARRDHAQSEASMEHADALLDRVTDDDTFRATAWLEWGTILAYGRHHSRGARALIERARTVFEKDHDDRETDAWEVLAFMARLDGRFEEAQQLSERDLEVRQATLGPENPRVAVPLLYLGDLQSLRGDQVGDLHRVREGLGDIERASGVFERTAFIDPTFLSLARSYRARALIALDRPGEALLLARDALDIAQRVYGPESNIAELALAMQSSALLALHRPAEAIAPSEHLIAEFEGDDDATNLGIAKAYLGFALLRSRKDVERGAELLREARAVLVGQNRPKRVAEIDADLANIPR